jgi:cytochrome b subunit of formate dehydrogenase
VTVKNPATGKPLAPPEPIKLDVPVVESGEVRWYKQFERAEMVSFAIAMVIAIVSGLALYAQKQTFGSFQDYVLLFLWGVGADQGKNLVQLLKS